MYVPNIKSTLNTRWNLICLYVAFESNIYNQVINNYHDIKFPVRVSGNFNG